MEVSGKGLVAVVSKIVTAALFYIALKDVITTKSEDSSGKLRRFDSFWFLTFANLSAQFLCSLVVAPSEVARLRKQETDLTGLPYCYDMKYLGLLPLAAITDFLMSRLSYNANIHLAATVVVLLKGSRTVFAAVLTGPIVRRKQAPFNWVGVGIITFGVALISLETLLRSFAHRNAVVTATSSTTLQVVGALCLAVGMEMYWALRYAAEDRLVKVHRVSNQAIVMLASLCGMSWAFLAWMFVSALGYESLPDTFAMISNNGVLQVKIIVMLISLGFLNLASSFVARIFSSVHNSILSQLNVVFIFFPQVIRYKVDEWNRPDEVERPGEKLDWFSVIKVLAFVFLFCGGLVYNGNIRLPFPYLYPPQKDIEGLKTGQCLEVTPSPETTETDDLEGDSKFEDPWPGLPYMDDSENESSSDDENVPQCLRVIRKSACV